MKTKPKKASHPAALPCFECDAGHLLPVVQDYTTHLPERGEVTVPAVPMLRCDQCGDVVIGDEGNQYIDTWLAKLTHAITPEEVQALLTKYKLTQKEASQITGLGEKNISRWLTGRARPSESVSNFLRLLLSDEGAFKRLRDKDFTEVTTTAHSLNHGPLDDEETQILKEVDYPQLVSVGVVTASRKPQEKRAQILQWSQSPTLRDFRQKMLSTMQCMAAYKDTKQKSSALSNGIWVHMGELAAGHVKTAPYNREKLTKAAKRLRKLTAQPLVEAARLAQAELAQAGVALVFIESIKGASLRGCTRLLTAEKALIIHRLKYRSLSQFWIILFHEIAHLLLHITEPGEAIPDYEERSTDQREIEANQWAHDELVPAAKEQEFLKKYPKPLPWHLKDYAANMQIHPAIAAELLNDRAGREVIAFGFLKKRGLFPQLTKEEASVLMATSTFTS